ncbi:MAG: sulfatase [Candidatus Binatia bacterium]
MASEDSRVGAGAGIARGFAAGIGAGLVWWAVEVAVTRQAGGHIPGAVAVTFLQLDLAAGAVSGLVVGTVLGLLGRARGAALAMGLVVAYGLMRIFAPPGYLAEVLYLTCAIAGAVAGVSLAGPGRNGPLGFLHLTLVTTVALIAGGATIGGLESTYFAFSEPSGTTQVALLVGLPLAGIAVDRLLGLVLRGHALRLAVEVAAVAALGLAFGRPMSMVPIDDPLVTAPPPPAGSPDVILVSMDTTRADHMSTYGYARETSPNLTAFAKDALDFTNAKSPAQWTVPGHASMLTGMFPSRHGAHYSGEHGGPKIAGRSRVFPLAPDKVTLAELLRDRGWSTGGFVANFANLDRSFGFAQGFQYYEDFPGVMLRPLPPVVRFVQQFVPYFAKKPFRSADEINAAALAWVDRTPKGRPVFLFLNYLEPHHWLAVPPYDAWSRELPAWKNLARKGLFTHAVPAKLPAGAVPFIAANYDGQIALMDHALGALLAALRARGRYENALIVVTADHGELLGEHEVVGHGGRMMYEGLLHVPMVVKLPGADHPRGEVATPVQLVDILPTVADVLEAPLPPGVQGQPVQHVTHEIVAEEEINPEFVQHYGAVYDRALDVIYDGDWKLILSSRGERLLFDLRADPGENTNLAEKEPARAADMERRLHAAVAELLTRVASVRLE